MKWGLERSLDLSGDVQPLSIVRQLRNGVLLHLLDFAIRQVSWTNKMGKLDTSSGNARERRKGEGKGEEAT